MGLARSFGRPLRESRAQRRVSGSCNGVTLARTERHRVMAGIVMVQLALLDQEMRATVVRLDCDRGLPMRDFHRTRLYPFRRRLQIKTKIGIATVVGGEINNQTGRFRQAQTSVAWLLKVGLELQGRDGGVGAVGVSRASDRGVQQVVGETAGMCREQTARKCMLL